MSLKFDTVVLDFDGTVCESGPGITKSAASAFERMGRPVPPHETLERFVGPPLLAAFADFGGMTREEAETAVTLYRERYSEVGLFEARIYPGIPALLRELKAAGARVCVASGKPERFLTRIIAHFDLAEYIDAIAGPRQDGFSSDKSDQVRAVLPEHADLSRVCMIGDRCFDIEAGKALGVTSIGVTYGYGTRAELEDSGADLIFEDARALRDCLMGGAPLPRGRFISFEGTDGCGKSTQISLLDEYLRERGWETVVSREPGGCGISEKIREILLSLESKGMSAECEALLYAASRIEHVKRVILPALEDGRTVLCDRFYDSSFAYQAYGRQLGADFIRQINGPALDLAEPDITLQFDIDRAEARRRAAKAAPADRLESEKDEFFARVEEGYRQCALTSPGRIRRIDSGRSIDEVFRDVLAAIR